MTAAAALLLRFMNNNRCLNHSSSNINNNNDVDSDNVAISSRHGGSGAVKINVVGNDSETNNVQSDLWHKAERTMDSSNLADGESYVIGGHWANSDLDMEYLNNTETEGIHSTMTDTDIGSHGVPGATRKRASPFENESSPLPTKWRNIESHKSPSDVSISTFDLQASRIELGDSLGIPSPVDDDNANDSVDQDMYVEGFETHFPSYFPAFQFDSASFSPPIDQNSSQNTNIDDLFGSAPLFKSSKEVHCENFNLFGNGKSENELSNRLYSQESKQSNSINPGLTIPYGNERVLGSFNSNTFWEYPIDASECVEMTRRKAKRERKFTRNGSRISKNCRKMLESVKGFMFVLNSDLMVDFVSENVIDYLGFHQNEMTGHSLSTFVHPSYLSVMDYIRSKLHCQSGNRGTLDRCHSPPIQLKHGQHKNSCYRTVNCHFGWVSAGRLFTCHKSCVRDERDVIIGMCRPTITTSSSLMPCKAEVTMLGRPQPRTFVVGGDEWFLFPFSEDFRRMSYEVARMQEIAGRLQYDRPTFKSGKAPQLNNSVSVFCLSDTGTGKLVAKHHSPCSKCGLRLTNTDDFLDHLKHIISTLPLIPDNSFHENDIMTHKNNQHLHNQLVKMHCRRRQPPRNYKTRNRLHGIFVFLHKHSVWFCARRRTASKPLINTKRETGLGPRLTSNIALVCDCCENTNGNNALAAAIPESSSVNHFSTDSTLSQFNSFNTTKHHPFLENSRLHKLLATALVSRHSDDCRLVNDQHEYVSDKDNHHVSEPEPSKQIEEKYYHHSSPKDNSATRCSRQGSDEEQENQNSLSSNIGEGFNLIGLEDIDLTTEFSFHSGMGDVIMPVERDLHCINDDVVLTDSSSNNSGTSSSDSNMSEQSTDPFASQASDDFTYSFDGEYPADGFQSFDHILNFPSNDESAPSNDVARHNTFFIKSAAGATADLNKNEDCSNKLLTEMDDFEPGSENPFAKYSRPFRHSLSSLLQSCDNPLKASLARSKHQSENGKSLLRSLLNKNEEKPATANRNRLVMHSKRLRECESHLQSKNAIALQTKELPVPQSHSSKKRRLSMPTPTQELPLPGSALKSVFASDLTAAISTGSTATRRNSLTDVLNGDDILSSLAQNVDGVAFFNTKTIESSSSSVSDDVDCPLPDDLVDLAMEYCNSLDSKQAGNLIADLNEQFGWLESFESVNATNFVNNSTQASHYLELESTSAVTNEPPQCPQYEMSVASKPQCASSTSSCLPLSTNTPTKTNRPQSSSSSLVNCASLTSKNINKSSHVSLLRQAVTSPDVDKLIQKLPLGLNCLSENSKSFDKTPPTIGKLRHPNILSGLVDTAPKSAHHNQTGTTEHHVVKNSNQSSRCISNSHNAKYGSEKTSAVSHISITAPPNSSKKLPSTKAGVSPMKLKIPAFNELTNRRRWNQAKHSSSGTSNNLTPKSSTCSIPSTNGVSVMVMRKESHRSRKPKTVATQTDNHPDEIYPALELSASDVFLTPSVYLDTSSLTQNALPLAASPPVTPGNKTASHSCNIFSSSLRSLASPRDSKDVMATPSPSPSASSTSSLSELELHLRGWSGPDSTLSSPLSSDTSDTPSEVPFLQRLLTGELSKDKYEKLDKDLLDKQRLSSVSN